MRSNDLFKRLHLPCSSSSPLAVWEAAIKQEEATLAEMATALARDHTPRRQETWYTDGSGLENGHRGGAAWCSTTGYSTKHYLGRFATVHDGELAGIQGALSACTRANVLLLTDSEAAIQTTVGLSRGAAPRSGIETSISRLLHDRRQRGCVTRIAWIKAHVGIPGNEEADRLAKAAAAFKVQFHGAETITSGGLKEAITAVRKRSRAQEGFGRGLRCHGKWGRKAVSSYTQLRTEAGPFRAFMASDRGGRRVESPECLRCSSRVPETGLHVVFECADHRRRHLRHRLIPGARTWADLDKPRHPPKEGVGGGHDAGEDEEVDLVATFFEEILRQPAEEDEDEEEGGTEMDGNEEERGVEEGRQVDVREEGTGDDAGGQSRALVHVIA